MNAVHLVRSHVYLPEHVVDSAGDEAAMRIRRAAAGHRERLTSTRLWIHGRILASDQGHSTA